MKFRFCIVCLLLVIFPAGKTNAQEKNTKDFIIEIPLEVNELTKTLEIDQERLPQIYRNKNRCKYLIINDINSLKRPRPEIKSIAEKLKPENLPFMEGILDTIAVLISDSRIAPGFKYLLFIGLDEELEIRYLCNREDNDEINPCYNNFIFTENEQFKSLKIKFGETFYDLQLLNPFYEEKVSKNFLETKNPGKFQLIISGGIPKGESSLYYQPDTSTSFQSAYYSSRIENGFSFQVQCNYSIKRFLLGIFMRYETYNFENITRLISSKVKGSVINLNYSGNGNWPSRIICFGATTAYDLMIFEKFIFTPSFNFGYYWALGTSSPFDDDYNSNFNGRYSATYSFNTGIAFKFPLYKQIWLTTGAIYQFNNFNATSYFADIKQNSYHMRQEIYRFDFGICYQF